MKKSIKVYSIIAVVLLILAALGYLYFHQKPAYIVFETSQPKFGTIAQYITATGKVEPVDTVSVGTQVSGIIKNLYVDFNSQVKKGELIAELDKSLLQATLDQNKANLLNARTQLVFQKSNFERQRQLYQANAISRADYDSALNLLGQAKANVAGAEAQVRSAQKNLSYASIYSPIDGVILFRNISPGQTVAASFNTPTLFIIARDISKMEVEAGVDEADIGGVRRGDSTSFTVEAFTDESFKGMVTDIRLHPSVAANVVTYTTIISASNNELKLKPGMTANIVIYTRQERHTLLIPSKALSFKPDSLTVKQYRLIPAKSTPGSGAATIWLLHGKTLIQRIISTGINDNVHVQVLSGLSDTDKVITNELSEKTAVATARSSPFLPKRPQGGGRR